MSYAVLRAMRQRFPQAADPQRRPRSAILTINGGSSSVKVAIYPARQPCRPLASAQIERIGSRQALLTSRVESMVTSAVVAAKDHREAGESMLEWLGRATQGLDVVAIGHRIVCGGAALREHQPITPAVRKQLRATVSIDPTHLPVQIALIETLNEQYGGVPQVACFDTAFHRSMPAVARRLPIPTEYHERGIQRFGFHGLSYEYLTSQLAHTDPMAAAGRVIYAHLGSGCSMAAVEQGRPVDTTMGFTPLSGMVMGTRPGDLDPGVIAYLLRTEKLSADQLDELLSHRCGLMAISQTSADMRDLLARSASDVRAAEAVELFCYRARQCVGSLVASMGGLDTIVFSGGIGEHAAEIRARICDGLCFLGVAIDAAQNGKHAAVISSESSAVSVRVLPTDEELVIARTVQNLLASAPSPSST